MRKRLRLAAIILGLGLGIGWYVTAQESPPFPPSTTEMPTASVRSECPPYDCP
jgi:hypothetical protein